jgi:hypothetical protein
VRGCDDDAAVRAALAHSPRDERRRHVRVEERDRDVVAREDFGRALRETLGEKAPVVADDDVRARVRVSRVGLWMRVGVCLVIVRTDVGGAFVKRGHGRACLPQELRVSLRDALDVLEGELVADDGAPAVGAEADGRGPLAASGHSAPPVCV